jgi:hypothetical protein
LNTAKSSAKVRGMGRQAGMRVGVEWGDWGFTEVVGSYAHSDHTC